MLSNNKSNRKSLNNKIDRVPSTLIHMLLKNGIDCVKQKIFKIHQCFYQTCCSINCKCEFRVNAIDIQLK